ncbi:26S proteasome non-ATPase regulatory subunit 10, partial [Tanacetum coccineum]
MELVLEYTQQGASHEVSDHLKMEMEMEIPRADVNLKNEGGRTALHYATSKGWVKIAGILLSNAANVSSKDK